MLKTNAALVVLVSICPTMVHGRTLSITYGDQDNFVYEGTSSEDHVYVDPTWVAAIMQVPNWGTDPFHDLDMGGYHKNVAFTFLFDLQPGETVTAATLTVGLRATNTGIQGVKTDHFRFEATDRGPTFENLGWLPIPDTGSNLRSLDLANVVVPGQSYLPDLQDGQLNVLIRNDTAVDYATLDLTVLPEPASLFALVGGLLVFTRRR